MIRRPPRSTLHRSSAASDVYKRQIPTSLLKSCSDALIPVITRIINHSLLTGSVAQCFKQALVTLLLKKPSLDKKAMKNYNAVSNLPFLSKLLRRVVLHQLVEHTPITTFLNLNSLLIASTIVLRLPFFMSPTAFFATLTRNKFPFSLSWTYPLPSTG